MKWKTEEIQNINKARSCFFEVIFKIKHLARNNKEKIKKMQITNIRNKKRGITTDHLAFERFMGNFILNSIPINGTIYMKYTKHWKNPKFQN